MPAALTKRRLICILAALAVIELIAAVCGIVFGASTMDVALLLGAGADDTRTDASALAWQIMLNLRLPRVLLAMLAGAALSTAGVSLQAILRNPLATPYTLGVASGAALGAVVAIHLGWGSLFGLTALPVASWIGAAGVAALVYLLARRGRVVSTNTLLLAGVTIGLVCSAMIMFLQYWSDPNQLAAMVVHLIGSLEVVGLEAVAGLLPFVLPGLAVLMLMGNCYNQLAMGEELAAGRGVNVAWVYRWTFFAAALVTAAVVAVCGPIGFVGLIVPHTLRLLLGSDHRLLLPAAALGGGTFLILCDLAARMILAPQELPAGVLTSLLGGPFFLIILLRRRN